MNRTVGVVVPAFRPDVDDLSSYVDALDGCFSLESIRIELDDPAPETVDALEECPATVNAVSDRRGKGAAITDGFEALETDVLAFADADGSTAPEAMAGVVDVVASGEGSLAVGSRRHPDAEVTAHQSVVRRGFGDVFAWGARRLLDARLYDYQCGAKAIDAGAWADVREHLREPGFGWDLELVAFVDALGYDTVEVPVVWEDDPRSTVSPVGTAVGLSRAVLGVHHRVRRLRGDWFHTTIASRRPRRGRVRPALVEEVSDGRHE